MFCRLLNKSYILTLESRNVCGSENHLLVCILGLIMSSLRTAASLEREASISPRACCYGSVSSSLLLVLLLPSSPLVSPLSSLHYAAGCEGTCGSGVLFCGGGRHFLLPRVRLTVWAPEGKSVRWRRIFSLQGWELIRKADEEDSSVVLMTKKKKKQFCC